MEKTENQEQTTMDKFERSNVFRNPEITSENQNVKTGENNQQTVTNRLSRSSFDKNSKRLNANKNRLLIALTAVPLFVFASGYALNKWFDKNAFASQKIERIQGTEKSVAIGISPDGEYLAHAVSNAGKRSLNVLHLPSNSNLQLVPPSEANYSGLVFSNDGNYIYFIEELKNESTLYKIPIIGGEAKKILGNVSGKISFAPNGEQFVFGRKTSDNETVIITANSDGSQERIVARKKAPEFFSTFDLSWSPDGKFIAFVEGEAKKDGKVQVAAINVESGERVAFSDKKWLGTDGLKWLADGSGVLVAAFESNAGSQVWVLPFPSGEPYKITNDLNNYGSIGLTADGKTLLAGQFQLISSIWLVNPNHQTAPKAIINGKHDDFILLF